LILTLLDTIKNILIRVDGSPQIGLGHVMRCLALADKLKSAHNCSVSFALKTNEVGERIIKDKNYNILLFSNFTNDLSYEDWLNECLKITKANVLILDVRDGLQPASVARIRNKGILTVTLDDPEDKRLNVDLAFYPPVPQVNRMTWTGFVGKLFSGWDYVILRNEFLKYYPAEEHITPRILITMGGSDPYNLTLLAAKSIEKLPLTFNADILLGPGFIWHKELNEFISQTGKPFQIHQNQKDLGKFFSSYDISIASFGITTYELARMGIPAIFLCLTDDHMESAVSIEESGLGINAGRYDQVDPETLYEKILEMLNDRKRMANIRIKGPETIDGKGADRISNLIIMEAKSNEI